MSVFSRTFSDAPPAALNAQQRCVALLVALALVSLLGVAAYLRPSPAGLGTHRQLGLPPCTFQWVLGWPCPACGMTTSWAHTVRGDLSAAVRCNAGGTLLCLLALACAPWLLAAGLTGRWLVRPPREAAWGGLVLVLVAVTLIDWAGRLLRG